VDPSALAESIESQLRAQGNPARAVHEQRYLHSDLTFLGTGVPAVRAVAVKAWRAKPLTRADLHTVVMDLWARRIHECRMAAVELLVAGRAVLLAEDMDLVETLVRDAGTWALVDPLAITVAGSLVERFGSVGVVLDRWSSDEDFWVRRAALLALLGALRRGEGDLPRFLRYADAMLDEREFFIRKAIGWVLRETARKRPAEVLAWLAPRTHRASGVTMREAVKYLPSVEAARLMDAYRRGVPAT
jgi:3-methyladenine DNA glycosylase AlkD